jgi:type IV pilus assembly protein PilO
MATARARHTWLIGGAIAAGLLVAATWFILIGPLNAASNSRYQQAEDARMRVPTLLSQLTALREQAQSPHVYQQALARARQALPATPASSDFLRELHAAGTSTDVTVSDLLVDLDPEATTHPAAYALPVTVTASGTAEALMDFVNQLQTQQPRAALVDSADLVPAGEGATLDGEVTLTLHMRIFVAQDVAAAPATPAEPETAGGN